MKKLIFIFLLFSCSNKKEFTTLHYKYLNTFTESNLYDSTPYAINYQCVFVGIDGVSYEVDTLQFFRYKEGDTLYIDSLIKIKTKIYE